MLLPEKQKLALAARLLIVQPESFPDLARVKLSKEAIDIIVLFRNLEIKTEAELLRAFYNAGFSLESEEHVQALEIFVNTIDDYLNDLKSTNADR